MTPVDVHTVSGGGGPKMSLHSSPFETQERGTGYEQGHGRIPGRGTGQEQPSGQRTTQGQPSSQAWAQQPMGGAQHIGGQQPMGGQHSIGGQQLMGGQQPMGGQQQIGGPESFEGSLTGPMRLTLHDFVESATVCDWCADRCIGMGPEMADCARLCRDVADLAATNVQLLARNSSFGSEAAELFAQAAEECARECAQHPHAHCQECAATLSRAVDSTRQLLGSSQGQGQAGTMGRQLGQQGGSGGLQQGQFGQQSF